VICRTWRGWTTIDKADKYEALLRTTILPGILTRNIRGFEAIELGRRALGEEVEFLTIMWFQSWDAVKDFAGPEWEISVVPPEARTLLTRFDGKAQHYEVQERRSAAVGTISRGRQGAKSRGREMIEAQDVNQPISASQLIDAKIGALGDWRGDTLARIRRLIREADAQVVEEVKWRKPSNSMSGVPVWEHAGIICTCETYKAKIKLTFARGAEIPDPAGLFNASLEGGTRRAIDIREGDGLDEPALQALIRAAAALNLSRA
jgi:hypothetical protein